MGMPFVRESEVHKTRAAGISIMSKIEGAIILGLVFLVAPNMVRFVLLAKWIDGLNEGLAPDRQFPLIGWWTPRERDEGALRARSRMAARERNSSEEVT